MNTAVAERTQAADVLLKEAGRPRTAAAVAAAAQTVQALETIGRGLQRIYQRACNVALNEEQTAAANKREADLIQQARNLLEPYGVGLGVNTDPRGGALSILTPKTRALNTMGGAEDGWRV